MALRVVVRQRGEYIIYIEIVTLSQSHITLSTFRIRTDFYVIQFAGVVQQRFLFFRTELPEEWNH